VFERLEIPHRPVPPRPLIPTGPLVTPMEPVAEEPIDIGPPEQSIGTSLRIPVVLLSVSLLLTAAAAWLAPSGVLIGAVVLALAAAVNLAVAAIQPKKNAPSLVSSSGRSETAREPSQQL